MKSGKGHQEEEEEAYEEFGAKKHASTSANNAKDGKNGDKATAMRSKHSVTEQRRRSKINERFQSLRDLIPDSDQKRDTASFLLEVIQYVTYLKEKVQHYEGSYQPLTSEPTKLTPWRKNYWNMQGFAGQPQTLKSSSGPVSAFSNRFDESNITPTVMHTVQQNPIESDPIRDASSRPMDTINEQANQAMGMNVPLQASMPVPVLNDGIFSHTLSGPVSDEPSTEGPSSFDALNPQDDLTIEGGTISISSVYSQGLLNSLAQALQSTGVDLSQANISVQINLGKRANTGSMPGIAITKDHGVPMPSGNQQAGHFHGLSHNEDSDQAHKKLRIG